jgi:hypothetical protein
MHGLWMISWCKCGCVEHAQVMCSAVLMQLCGTATAIIVLYRQCLQASHRLLVPLQSLQTAGFERSHKLISCLQVDERTAPDQLFIKNLSHMYTPEKG